MNGKRIITTAILNTSETKNKGEFYIKKKKATLVKITFLPTEGVVSKISRSSFMFASKTFKTAIIIDSICIRGFR